MTVKTFISAMFVCLCVCARLYADAGAAYIREVNVVGNRSTREEILAHFITLNVGDVFDTAQVRITREKLLNTRLYDNVEILVRRLRDDFDGDIISSSNNNNIITDDNISNDDIIINNDNIIINDDNIIISNDNVICNNDIIINNDNIISNNDNIINNNDTAAARAANVAITIVLKESIRLDLDYGIRYWTHLYGLEHLWFRYSFGIIQQNFRGRHEQLRVAASVWDYKAAELAWYKPFLPSRYFMSVGAGADVYPDNMIPIDYTDLYATLNFGRRFGAHSRLSVGTAHIYRNRTRDESSPFAERIPDNFRAELHETFLLSAYTVDKLPSRFNPRNGWLTQTRLRTNRPYPGGNIPFFELTNELRYYVPMFREDIIALRFNHIIRDVDAGEYHRLTHGGAGEVRGYSEDELGWNFTGNSSLMLSAKYHRHIFTTPHLPMPLLNLVYGTLRTVRFRFDATFIADYARLYHEPLGALTTRGAQTEGAGLGGGIRIMVPDIRQSGCIEVVFGRHVDDNGNHIWEPTLHIYLDVFF